MLDRARMSCPVALVVALVLASCSTRETAATTTLAPLVPPDSLPQETFIVTTTVAPSSDPSSPLLAALPEGDCAYADVLSGEEITFVVGDRLYGVAPDGTAARCLAVLRADQVGHQRHVIEAYAGGILNRIQNRRRRAVHR